MRPRKPHLAATGRTHTRVATFAAEDNAPFIADRMKAFYDTKVKAGG
jgi:hypothetical protein